MAKILVTRMLPGDSVENLAKEHEVLLNRQDRDLDSAELDRMAEGASGIVSMLSNKINREFLAAHPQLKVVANYAVGYNNIDLEAAKEHGVTVTNTPGVLTEATADVAWALIMSCARKVVPCDRFTRSGKFDGWAPELFLGTDVHGATLGIVGMGRIGMAAARRGLGFGMKILYYSRTAKPEAEKELGAERVDLETLLRQSDFVSLHCPLTPETTYLLDEPHLAMMKKTAILVNTARGPVVDESALVKMLKNGKIAGAGFDVYEHEPELSPGLTELDSVVLLPHIGSGTTATRRKMAEMAVENVRAVLDGKSAPNAVVTP